MRCDQNMGLCPEAIHFLQENELMDICPCCKTVLRRYTKTIGSYDGMHENQYSLIGYQLKDGRVAQEFLQTSVWDSGPMMYLGLRIGDIEIKWSEELL